MNADNPVGLEEAATPSQRCGFASSSAFIHYAIDQELTGREDNLTGAERLAHSIEMVRRDLFRIMRVQLDTLAKRISTHWPRHS